MGRPFNFFQTSQSGQSRLPDGSRPSAYFGGFTGFYTPPEILNQVKDYVFPLNVLIPNDPFNFQPTLDAILGGSVESANSHVTNFEVQVAGNFFPVSNEDSETDFKFTGQLVKSELDAPVFDTIFTGEIAPHSLDFSTSDFKFYGNVQNPPHDVPTYDVQFNGKPTGALLESTNYQINFSGNFVKYEQDNLLLNTVWSGITFKIGHLKVTGDLGTETTELSLNWSHIRWEAPSSHG